MNPRYIPIDDDGMPLDSISVRQKLPKWRQPSTDFQRRFLSIFQVDLFPNNKAKTRVDADGNERQVSGLSGREIRTALEIIERSMQPMDVFKMQGGHIPDMPTEWVEYCLEWAKRKRASGVPISMNALISFIRNKNARSDWANAYLYRRQQALKAEPKPEDYQSNVTEENHALDSKYRSSIF